MSATRIELAELIALSLPARRFDLNRLGRRQLRSASGHTPRLRGRGMTFEEHRGYQPGDEPRFIDWRVTARTGELHVKVYREEHERPVHLLLDIRPGMAFGSRRQFKSCLAAQASALIAWTAAHSKERIGGVVLAEKLHDSGLGSARHGVLAWLRLLSQTDTGASACPSLAEGCLHLRRVTRPGSIIVLCSDFADLDAAATAHLAELSRHNQIILLPVSDPLESQPPAQGMLPVRDQEQTRWFDFGQAAKRQAWREHFARRQSQLQGLAAQCKAVLLPLSTAETAQAQLAVHLAGR